MGYYFNYLDQFIKFLVSKIGGSSFCPDWFFPKENSGVKCPNSNILFSTVAPICYLLPPFHPSQVYFRADREQSSSAGSPCSLVCQELERETKVHWEGCKAFIRLSATNGIFFCPDYYNLYYCHWVKPSHLQWVQLNWPEVSTWAKWKASMNGLDRWRPVSQVWCALTDVCNDGATCWMVLGMLS